MKKYILTALVMLSMAALSQAELRGTPTGPDRALASADYGGVNWSTAAFGPVSGSGVHFTTACQGFTTDPCSGVVYGVIFSTGNSAATGSGGSGDFVDIFDSTSSDRAQAEGAMVRLYNQYNVIGSTASGFASTGMPLRFYKGLIFRPGQSTNNLITVPYYKTP